MKPLLRYPYFLLLKDNKRVKQIITQNSSTQTLVGSNFIRFGTLEIEYNFIVSTEYLAAAFAFNDAKRELRRIIVKLATVATAHSLGNREASGSVCMPEELLVSKTVRNRNKPGTNGYD